MNLEKEIFDISLNDIIPNRFQPREIFKDEELQELAKSIKEHGVIQPIIVRKIGDKYEIIAGERRYRASKLAEKETIPALVRNIDDKEAAKIALLENLQRSNLTPIEEAKTYQTILKIDNITQDELATNLGKSQSTIANKLRLLTLSEEVQTALLNSQISERHARSLLSLTPEQQDDMLHKIIDQKLTVRQLDEEVMKLTGKAPIADAEPETKEEVGPQPAEPTTPVEAATSVEQPKQETTPAVSETPASPEIKPETIVEQTPEAVAPAAEPAVAPQEQAPIEQPAAPTTEAVTSVEQPKQETTPAVNDTLQSAPEQAPAVSETPASPEIKPETIVEQTPETVAPTVEPAVAPQEQAPVEQPAEPTTPVEAASVEQPKQETTPAVNDTLQSAPEQAPAVSETPASPEIKPETVVEQTPEAVVPAVEPTVAPQEQAPAEQTTEPIIPVAESVETPISLDASTVLEQQPEIQSEEPTPEPVVETQIEQPTVAPSNIFDKLRVQSTDSEEKEPMVLPTPDVSSVINAPEPEDINKTKEINDMYDLRFAINNFRQAIQNTEKFGFKVTANEYDKGDKYQIVIDIDKK